MMFGAFSTGDEYYYIPSRYYILVLGMILPRRLAIEVPVFRHQTFVDVGELLNHGSLKQMFQVRRC